MSTNYLRSGNTPASPHHSADGTKPLLRKPLIRPVVTPPETPIPMVAVPLDRVITTRQVSAILRVSEDTLRKWRIRRKHLSYLKYPDGAVRYRLSTVLKFLEKCTVEL